MGTIIVIITNILEDSFLLEAGYIPLDFSACITCSVPL